LKHPILSANGGGSVGDLDSLILLGFDCPNKLIIAA